MQDTDDPLSFGGALSQTMKFCFIELDFTRVPIGGSRGQ
jgi:hypothetical protein